MKSISLFTLGLIVMIMVEACSDTEPMEIPISLDIPGKFTYISDNEIHVLDKDQLLSTNLNCEYLNSVEDAQWILAGTKVLNRSFCHNKDGIHVMDPASGQNQLLIEGGNNGLFFNAVTNLSGQRIAVIGQNMLAVYQYDGLSVQKIDSTPTRLDGRLSLSPDGEKVVVFRGPNWLIPGHLNIHILGTDSLLFTHSEEIFPYVHSVSWSNQSDQFVFDGTGSEDIYVSTFDRNELRKLISTPDVEETSPAWSPIADEIVFVRTFPSEHRAELVLYDLKLNEGDVIFRHDDFVDIKGLQWSQDGSKIAFYNDAEFNGGIYVIDRSGSELTRYTNRGWEFDWIYP